jgi:hypothetical protein
VVAHGEKKVDYYDGFGSLGAVAPYHETGQARIGALEFRCTAASLSPAPVVAPPMSRQPASAPASNSTLPADFLSAANGLVTLQ